MAEVVVVTGATSGVGRAIVRRFARDGAHIGLIARDRKGLKAARREVEAAGGKALVLRVDVADAESVESAATAVEEALGPIDVWVNNAMTTVFSFFQDVTPAEYQRATDVTYHGTVWGTMAALKRMVPRDRGTIVQVGSAMAYQGIPLQAPYCGAKHATKGMVESLRTELRHKGSRVHVTMVQLPGLNTPQFVHGRVKELHNPQPVAPIYQPEVAGDAVHFAAHHRRRELWVGAPSLYTIIGNKLAPGIAERYLARTAVSGQQTDEPLEEDVRPGNLFEEPKRDEGAHGPFSDKAHGRSLQLMATKHRALAGALLAGAGAAAAAAVQVLRTQR
jgi:NAD(P)-dependent dehydrogenase (short-subunit alcohol dehydrogenase family)